MNTFKDALKSNHSFAYAIGHLPNDLVITIWSSYSTVYFDETVGMSGYDSGLVVLVGQIVDAIFQPIISYCSDNFDTKLGKRMPWYIFGNILVLPCFFLIFNPPKSMLEGPNVSYFIAVPGIMNIGQGAV